MSESALRNWGAEKGETGDKAAVESDLVGGDSAFGQEGPFEEDQLAGAEPVDAEPAPAAKRGKKNKKPLLIGLGIAAVLLVGAAAFKKTQQHPGGQMLPAAGSEESVEGAVARPGASPQDQGSAVVVTPTPGEAQIAPVLGAEPSAEASAPAGSVIAPAPAASMPVISQAPAAQMAAGGRTSLGQSAALAAPAQTSPAQTAPAPSPEALAAQEAQRQLVAGLQSDVAELRKTVARLQGELAARPVVQVAAAPKPAAPRPQRVPEAAPKPRAAEPAPVTAPQAAAPVAAALAPAAAQTKGKVRTDYRIYAMVEGRVWVKQGDNEAEMVDIRSPLLDGSTVLSIDPARPAVVTSAGEIRTR